MNPLSNPCNGCHNPHLAKRNSSAPADPTLSAISKPSDHGNLFGPATPAERMSKYTTYAAPYSTFGAGREPGAAGAGDGSDMPDYVGFCTDCHNATNVIYSTRKGGNLQFINWSSTGDVHGAGSARDGYSDKGTIKAPYNEASGLNYVLSCLDCHEPHGSSSKYLLRRQVNGVAVPQITGDTNAGSAWSAYCSACHNVTVSGGGSPCGSAVHGGYPGVGITCVNCHYHGGSMCPSPFSKTL